MRCLDRQAQTGADLRACDDLAWTGKSRPRRLASEYLSARMTTKGGVWIWVTEGDTPRSEHLRMSLLRDKDPRRSQ